MYCKALHWFPSSQRSSLLVCTTHHCNAGGNNIYRLLWKIRGIQAGLCVWSCGSMNATNEKCSQTDLVNPQLAHNDVVHCGGDLSPHIVVPAGVELQVNGTWGGNSKDKRLIREKRYHSCFADILQLRTWKWCVRLWVSFSDLNLVVNLLNSTCGSWKTCHPTHSCTVHRQYISTYFQCDLSLQDW